MLFKTQVCQVCFLKTSSDGDFTFSLGTVERALGAQLPWKLRLSKAKFSF